MITHHPGKTQHCLTMVISSKTNHNEGTTTSKSIDPTCTPPNQKYSNTNSNCNSNSEDTTSPDKQSDTISPVINLSTFTLTRDHISLLSKGLTFCPTPREPNLSSTRADMDKFHRQMRLRHYFQKDSNFSQSFIPTQSTDPNPLDLLNSQKDEWSFDDPKFRSKSKWKPPPGPPCLEAMATANEIKLQSLIPRSPLVQNLTKAEKQCLAELKTRNDIIIKPADKGSSIVIQNIDDYVKEGLRQLNDTNFYQKLDRDLAL